MQLPVRYVRIVLLAPLPALRVKPWQPHMFPLTLLVEQFMPYRPSIEPPMHLMPTLPWKKNEIGRSNTYSS